MLHKLSMPKRESILLEPVKVVIISGATSLSVDFCFSGLTPHIDLVQNKYHHHQKVICFHYDRADQLMTWR